MNRIALVLLSFVFLVSPIPCFCGNCTTGNGKMVLISPSRSTVLEIDGRGSMMFPAIDGQIQPNTNTIGVYLIGLIERPKVFGSNAPSCTIPKRGNPWASTSGPPSFVPTIALQNFTMESFDCYFKRYTDYPRPGIERNTVQVDYVHTLVDGMVLQFLYQFTNASFDEIPSNDTTHTEGNPLVLKYREDKAKFTIIMEGIPWSGNLDSANSSSTFLSAHFSIEGSVVPGQLQYSDDRSTDVSLIAQDHFVSVSFDKGFFVDGVPFESYNAYPQKYTLDTIAGNYVEVIGISICDEDGFGYFNRTVYDPSLAALFTSLPDSTKPPVNKINVAAISGGVVAAVVVVTAGLLMAAKFVPKLNRKFFPSRVALEESTSWNPSKSSVTPRIEESQLMKSETRSDGWSRGTKPVSGDL